MLPAIFISTIQKKILWPCTWLTSPCYSSGNCSQNSQREAQTPPVHSRVNKHITADKTEAARALNVLLKPLSCAKITHFASALEANLFWITPILWVPQHCHEILHSLNQKQIRYKIPKKEETEQQKTFTPVKPHLLLQLCQSLTTNTQFLLGSCSVLLQMGHTKSYFFFNFSENLSKYEKP